MRARERQGDRETENKKELKKRKNREKNRESERERCISSQMASYGIHTAGVREAPFSWGHLTCQELWLDL